jgi:hypothetical protein
MPLLLGKGGGVRVARALLLTTAILGTFCASSARSHEAVILNGDMKFGVAALSEDGTAASTIESYNISKGLTLNRLLLNGRYGASNILSIDVGNVNKHQRNAHLEFTRSHLLHLRFDHARMRFLQPGAGNPELFRERTGFSGSVTPSQWVKLYGGFSGQEKEGDRVALLSEEADFPGTIYDYSIRTRNIGGLLGKNGRSVELTYEWRRFESERKPLMARDGRKLRASLRIPIARMLRFSASYISDESILEDTDDVLQVKSYSGTLTALPIRRLKFSGHIDYRNADNDLSDIYSNALKVGGKSAIELYPMLTTEVGYEYTRREDELRTGSDAGDRRVSSNAFIVGLRARPTDKARVTIRFRTRSADRDNYADLTGPFDTDNLLARLESWPTSYLRFAVTLEDKDRSNEELMTSGGIRGINGFADFSHSGLRYGPSLRLSGSFSRSEFKDPETSFETDNVLLSARLRLMLSPAITVETGITHIEIRKDLNIRKDIALASLGYEVMPGYAIELRYDLFSYDDFMNYRDNFASNVFSLSFSKKFGLGDNVDQ